MAKLKKAAMLAKLEGIEGIQERDLISDWILITYDLPVTPEGMAARSKFLHMAPRLGAMMHTRSVYFMPQSQASEVAALELSKVGQVFVWTSSLDDVKSKELTQLYDSRIRDEIKQVRIRIANGRKHVTEDKMGMADRMMHNTIEAYNQVLFTAIHRGNKHIINDLTNLRHEIEELHASIII